MTISDKARRLGETVLVGAVAVILMVVWIRGVDGTQNEASVAAQKAEVVTIAKAIQAYGVEHGSYPAVANGLPFCQPFNIYNGELCLGVLIGEYIEVEEINLVESDLVYMNEDSHVVIAADIPVNQGVATSNRCNISGIEFWCVRLYR